MSRERYHAPESYHVPIRSASLEKKIEKIIKAYRTLVGIPEGTILTDPQYTEPDTCIPQKYLENQESMTSLPGETGFYIDTDDAKLSVIDRGTALRMNPMTNQVFDVEVHTHIRLNDRVFSPPSGHDLYRALCLSIAGIRPILQVIAPEGLYTFSVSEALTNLVKDDTKLVKALKDPLVDMTVDLWEVTCKDNTDPRSIRLYTDAIRQMGFSIVHTTKPCPPNPEIPYATQVDRLYRGV